MVGNCACLSGGVGGRSPRCDCFSRGIGKGIVVSIGNGNRSGLTFQGRRGMDGCLLLAQTWRHATMR